MTTLTKEFDHERVITRQDVVELWQKLPKDRPLPVTPETTRAMIELIAELYGDALQELEKH